MKATQLSKTLKNLADPAIAEHSQRFFKTGKGEYGEGDKFLGIRVPVLRKQVKKYKDMPLDEIQSLLKSSLHEERLCALFLLIHKFTLGDAAEKAIIYQLYLGNTGYINNWDLVDSSAHLIVGVYLEDKNKQPIYDLVRSDNLWERRIAIISTLHFIRKHQFDEALDLSKQLLTDKEDLIHKAVGWMLREIGKRDLHVEECFLKAHYRQMPRTMLRYAIEKFPEQKRKKYLAGMV
ncbi:MAG: DNA alkylation repair protein [Desulfobacteraceae bacterium 4572_123]|nr:MAG: DNA alkylation repair protein [Desulfobacteraceae bacterium 4572_123]